MCWSSASAGLTVGLLQCEGALFEGRWTQRRTYIAMSLYGRQYRADVGYDLDTGRIAYRINSEAFF